VRKKSSQTQKKREKSPRGEVRRAGEPAKPTGIVYRIQQKNLAGGIGRKKKRVTYGGNMRGNFTNAVFGSIPTFFLATRLIHWSKRFIYNSRHDLKNQKDPKQITLVNRTIQLGTRGRGMLGGT